MLLFLYSCGNSQTKYFIAQCYSTKKISGILRESTTNPQFKDLVIYDNQGVLSENIPLNTAPCEIEKISNDTVYLTYIRFVKIPSDNLAVQFKNISIDADLKKNVVLSEKFLEVIGAGSDGEINADSISIQGEYIVAYRAPSRLDSFNINHVFYTGDYFFLSKYGKFGKDTKKIIAKNNQDAREKYYKYVDIKVSGKLNEILGLYGKL